MATAYTFCKKKLRLHNLIVSISILSLVACTTTLDKQADYQIVHIVLVWLKEPNNEQHIRRIIEIVHQLKEIEEIEELRVGKSIPSKRKIVDDSYDIGLYMIFKNEESMHRYLVHPKHKHAVKTIIKPLTRKIRVHDFLSE